MTTIAVTGATGKLGSATIGFLLSRGTKPGDIVAVVRDPAKAESLAARGVQLRRASYTDVNSLENALRGVDRLAFISTSALGDERMLHHRNVVSAARTAKVGHILYTSVIKPAADAKFAASPGHFHTEALVRETGIPFTFLRNNLYLDLVPLMFGGALASGTLAHNGGAGRIGFVARQDIAQAFAAMLTGTGHENRVYPITAVSPYSLDDIAAALGRASGKQVVYQPLSTEDFRKLLDATPLPPPVITMTLALGEAIRAGEFDAGSRDLERLMGHAPTTLESFVANALAPQALQ